MKAKITKRLVEDLTVEAGKELWVWDSELPGFGVRVKDTGVKAYVIQYRNLRRQSRKITIGRHGILTPEEARRLARQTLAAVERGEDPAQDRQARRDAVTVAELAKRFDDEHISVRLKASTAREYRLPGGRDLGPAAPAERAVQARQVEARGVRPRTRGPAGLPAGALAKAGRFPPPVLEHPGLVAFSEDGFFGSKREGWRPDQPGAFDEPLISIPWVQILELLGRVPEGTTGEFLEGGGNQQ